VISGIVQGAAEFLPISSSGHLVILHRLIGIGEPQIGFDIFLHLGTLLAIFIVFGKDILECFTSKKRIGFLVIAGSVVTVAWVLVFGKGIEASFGNPKTVGAMFIVTGAWLILGSFVRFGTEGLTGLKAVLIGLAQGIAVMPGISRSGATISTGLFLGLSGDMAARFSFLLSIPAVIGAVLFKVRDGGAGFGGFSGYYIAGFAAALVTGVFSLKLLLRMLAKSRFHWFGIYCILLGISVLLFL